MLKHVNVYGILLILTAIHGTTYFLNGDVLLLFTNGNAGALLFSPDIALQARAVGLLLLSLIISLYSLGLVSRTMRGKTSTTPANISLFFACVAFAILVVAAVLGLYVVLSAVQTLSASGGVATLLSVVFSIILALGISVSMVKFSFAPSYVGMGFLPKEALAQSWHATRGKLLHTIILLFAILLVTGLIQGVIDLLTENMNDDSIIAAISFVGSAVGLFYSGTVLALGAPDAGTISAPRKHGKK